MKKHIEDFDQAWHNAMTLYASREQESRGRNFERKKKIIWECCGRTGVFQLSHPVQSGQDLNSAEGSSSKLDPIASGIGTEKNRIV